MRELAIDLPEILADPIGMNQVLVNLVLNAIHAMARGGRLTLRTSWSDERVSLSVQDTGTGMDESVIARIFEPFFTTKGVGQGTGLGLPVAREIATQHGGTIHVEELPPGKGESVRLRLPRRPSPVYREQCAGGETGTRDSGTP